jgi:hypothetical protein
MAAMDPLQLAQAVKRAVQFTVAQKLTREVQLRIPALSERVAITCGVAVVAVSLRTTRKPSANLAADLALTVATTTLMQGVAASGPNSLPLSLAHLCAVLEAGSALSALALGELAESFLGQVQYAFANAMSALLLSAATSVVALAAAGGLAALSAWRSGLDSALSTAFSQAAFNVVKTLLLNSIPAGLQLPTIAGLLAFAKPLHEKLGGVGQSIYSFALYQAGDSIQTAIEASLPPFVAAAAAASAAFAVPVESLRAATQVAAVGSLTDWVLSELQQAADQDPVLSLVSLLVFCKVLLESVNLHK